jgi:hypothetical protein
MNYYFNSDYVLWHDEKRTYIIEKYQNNDSSRGWISMIHPVQAMILSFFTQVKPYEEILNDLAIFLNTDTDSGKEIIKPFLCNTKPFYTEYQGKKFQFPKNVLLEESVNNMQSLPEYSVEEFTFTELDFVSIRSCYRDYQTIKQYLAYEYNSIVSKYENVQYDRNEANNNVSPIWICWWDGEDAMPEIVKTCFKSVCYNSGNRPVKLITKNNYHEFISIPDYIIEKVTNKIISLTHFSDILRMCLLHDYGGLWLDATVYVTSKINSSVFDFDVFTVRNDTTYFYKPEYKWVTFIIGGQKRHPLFAIIRDMLLEYWKRNVELIDYLLFDYYITIAYDRIPVIRNALNRIPYSNNQVCTLVQYFLGKAFNSGVYEQICSDTDFHKLTWKENFPLTVGGEKTFYEYILSK